MPGYPVLPTGVAYYRCSYKPNVASPNLMYSQGWYATCGNAMPATVWLYDDDLGFSLISCPVGPSAMPSGMQDGHTIQPISITDAQALINSYPIEDFTTIDTVTLASMKQIDFFKGVWGGDKLAQKFTTILGPDVKIKYERALNSVLDKVLNGK